MVSSARGAPTQQGLLKSGGWALGTIMAKLVNLRPLFPGSRQVDQVARICELLGDPSDE